MKDKFSYDRFLKYRVDAESLDDFYNRYGKPQRYIERGQDYFDCVIESATKDIKRYGHTFITHHDSKCGEVVAYYPHQSIATDATGIFKAVLHTLSILKHQRVSDADRASLRDNMDFNISEMDKRGVTYNLQNALFWIAEMYDSRTCYLDDMLQKAFERAAAIIK